MAFQIVKLLVPSMIGVSITPSLFVSPSNLSNLRRPIPVLLTIAATPAVMFAVSVDPLAVSPSSGRASPSLAVAR